MYRTLLLLLVTALFLSLAACGAGANGVGTSPTPTIDRVGMSPTPTTDRVGTSPTPTTDRAGTSPTPTTDRAGTIPASTQTPTPRPTLAPDEWKSLPVIPTVSDRARQIYKAGLALGNNPQAFSKIGDCQNVDSLFLGMFDENPPLSYDLGQQYSYLQATIQRFSGSFRRSSLAVRGGLNVAAVLAPIYVDRSHCAKTESSLACELRLHKPSIALISMETWWSERPAEVYEQYMRQVLDYTISQGVVPVLATKADNLEGDYSINATIARLAWEYDIPLWNYWAAVQPLPHGGLTEDGFHLTHGLNHFTDPLAMQGAWPWRNLTALQTLDSVWRGLEQQP